jgi:hypothetical protein
MTGCPEYNYWDPDNEKLKIKNEMLPSWVAALNGLDALHKEYKKHYPEMFNEGGEDEHIGPSTLADPLTEGPEESESDESDNEHL